MKKTLNRTFKLLVLVAVLSLASLPLAGPSAQAAPGCGECTDGGTQADLSCSGARRNCSECTVCAK